MPKFKKIILWLGAILGPLIAFFSYLLDAWSIGETGSRMGLPNYAWLIIGLSVFCGTILLWVLKLDAAVEGNANGSAAIKNPPSESVKQPEIEKARPNLKAVTSQFGLAMAGVNYPRRGEGHRVIYLRISNELIDGQKVGMAKDVKAHITYLDGNRRVLHKECPGHWTHNATLHAVDIPPGEHKHLAIAFDHNQRVWATAWHQESFVLIGTRYIEVRLLNLAADELAPKMTFAFDVGEDFQIKLPEPIPNF